MKDITVLTTACAAMFMPGFFRCLKENGERRIKIIGVDMAADPMMGQLLDGYYQVGACTAPGYVEQLLDICRRERVDVFFPHISTELPIILARIAEFRQLGVRVAITDSQTLLVANNKRKLYEAMAAGGLPTPAFYPISGSQDLKKYAPLLGYPDRPVVVKAAESSGSRGVRVVRADLSRADAFLHSKPSSLNISMEEMCRTLDECQPMPDLLVMEYLPGCEYTVDLLADRGETLYIAGRRNYESSMSIAMASRMEPKEEAFALCRQIIQLLKLDGNIGFDFMLDENDRPVLTDLNPRITATIVLYLAGGLNLPYLRVKQLLGETLPEVKVEYGAHLKRRYLDVIQMPQQEQP